MDFGYVIKRSEYNFVINVDLTDYYSGYNVVSRDVDPYNKYNIEDVRAYCEANPQMVLAEHPLKEKEKLKRELVLHELYLRDTDYMAIKCAEKGISMASAYPDEYIKRQQARDRINEIRAILGEA